MASKPKRRYSAKQQEKRDGQQDCQVCGRPTRAYFHKLYVCCACTMFYRRNFRTFPRSTCRYTDGNCDLRNGPRRFCLHCRLKSCRQLGLRMWGKNLVVQTNGLPSDDIPEERMDGNNTDELGAGSGTEYVLSPASSSSSGYSSSGSYASGQEPTPSACTDHLHFLSYEAVELPTLRQVTLLFRQADDQQKFLSALQKGAEVLDYTSPHADLIYMDRVQFAQLEPRFVRLCAVLLNQWLDQFVGGAPKRAMLSELAVGFSMLHKVQNSVRQFGAWGSAACSLFSGYYTELDDMEAYLADAVNEKTEVVLRRFTSEVFVVFLACLDEARAIHIHPVESAYLLAQIFFRIARKHGHVNQDMHNFATNLDREFHVFLETSRPFEEPNTRHFQLCATLDGLCRLICTYIDAHQMMDIFCAQSNLAMPSVLPDETDLDRFCQMGSV